MPAGNIPVVLTASAFNNDMEENVLVEEGAESGRRQTSQNDGTARLVVNIPTDTKVLEFRVSCILWSSRFRTVCTLRLFTLALGTTRLGKVFTFQTSELQKPYFFFLHEFNTLSDDKNNRLEGRPLQIK